jgi:glycosyltransferase involved in cell wall biosynthesis
MKVLYDSHIFANQKVGGVSRYHYELLDGLIKRGVDARISGLFVKNKYLLNNQFFSRSFLRDPMALFSKINMLFIKKALRNPGGYDVFHPTDTRLYLLDLLPAGKPMVFTIHDMIPERMGEVDPLSTAKYRFAQRATKIIAVSENTKQDIIHYYQIPSEKIEVIHHGVSFFLYSTNWLRKALPDSYILFVGGRNGYKNFEGFIRTIAPLLLKRSELFLVCAGGKSFTADELRLFDTLGISKKVIGFTLLSDDELAKLYSNAMIFVFPSLYEGFGIPILEAWSCKVPVVLSRCSCFPEIAGDAAIYFMPDDSQSLINAVNSLLEDESLRKAMIERGTTKLKAYQWQKAIDKTLMVYESVL